MKRPVKTNLPTPPRHLRAATRRWWSDVVATFALDDHHLRLLTLAGESWDRCVQARESLAEHGVVYLDRFGSPKARPEVAIERDSRVAFARLVREGGHPRRNVESIHLRKGWQHRLRRRARTL